MRLVITACFVNGTRYATQMNPARDLLCGSFPADKTGPQFAFHRQTPNGGHPHPKGPSIDMRRTSRSVLLSAFRALATVTTLATTLSLSRARAWWVRAMDFPRLQLAALGAVSLACACSTRKHLSREDRWLAGATGAAVLVQLAHFAKYTPFTPKQVLRKPDQPGTVVSILTANVRMRNTHAEKLVALVRRRNPDLLLLLEVNKRWTRQLEPLYPLYPHRVLHPLENTYGLMLLSRFPLQAPQVRFLVQADVPSIRTRLRLNGGKEVWFYGLHPRPPVRGNLDGEIELPGSAPRDAELIVAAMETRDLRDPIIVAGDFNDVAWSHTTRRFQRLSRTLDPRVGRGLYSTFHARNRLLRFPLDHLFISEHFAMVEFTREADIGSDHFPLYARLVIAPSAPAEHEPPKTNKTDLIEARNELEEAASP